MAGAKALIFVLSLATSLGTTTEKYGAVLILLSESQSLARQLVSYILFNDIHTSQKTEEILEDLRFSIQSHQARLSENLIPLRERCCRRHTHSLRRRAKCVAEGGVVKHRVTKQSTLGRINGYVIKQRGKSSSVI